MTPPVYLTIFCGLSQFAAHRDGRSDKPTRGRRRCRGLLDMLMLQVSRAFHYIARAIRFKCLLRYRLIFHCD